MMDILYTVDNNFVPQLAANIYSVCSNAAADSEITFHVFSKGISNSNLDKLNAFVSKFGESIRFYDISNFMEQLGFNFDTTGWNEIVMARLLMARFLPTAISKIIYLDADTIVRGDISELWLQSLENNVLGMVPEPTVDKKRDQLLGLDRHFYFNAGVLLVDLNRWRELDCENHVLTYCKDKGDLLFANDQDALNGAFSHLIKPLSIGFNYSNVFDYYPFEFLDNLMPGFSSPDDYLDSKGNPTIVHYLGEERPWREGNTHRFSKDYKFCLSNTPWSDTPEEKGWKLYFVLWRIFNKTFGAIPQLRYGILNSLIPLFISFRAFKRNRSKI